MCDVLTMTSTVVMQPLKPVAALFLEVQKLHIQIIAEMLQTKILNKHIHFFYKVVQEVFS